MALRLRSIKNPKRSFSRRHRRRDRAIDPDDLVVVSRPGGFFAQYMRQLELYVISLAVLCAGAVLQFKEDAILAVPVICAVSLVIPLALWVRYRRTKKRLELIDADVHTESVAEKLT